MKNSVMASGSSGPVGRPVRRFTMALKTPSGMGIVSGGISWSTRRMKSAQTGATNRPALSWEPRERGWS
jgi:hypothetical protein